jgi:hypothetical protein
MNKNEVTNKIQTLFAEASQDLLKGMNCAVSIVDDNLDIELDAPIALIDAGSAELEVQVGLELPLTVLALTYPVPNISIVDDESLEDWISELSNQLIGRLKSKLMKSGQEIMLGLPSSYFGTDITDLMTTEQSYYSVFYNVDGEVCAFHLGIEALNDEPLFHETEDDDDALMESEIELF